MLKLTSFAVATAFVLASSLHAGVISTYTLQGTAGFGLLPGSEPGFITGGTGGEIGAGIFLDDDNDADPNTNLLTISNVGWGSSQGFIDLFSIATASHIHGPTASNNGNGFTETVGVLFHLTRSSNAVTGGTFTNTPLSLTGAQVTDLNNGKLYINLHTSGNPGGEMRGFIVMDAVPEPASVALCGLGTLFLAACQYRRRARS